MAKRYTKQNIQDPVFEFENDYIIETVVDHVPVGGTNQEVRILSNKGNKTNPGAAPLSGNNMELIENSLVDLNKIDASHNVDLIPANVYYTDTELINYMITNGYKDISVANTVYFHPSVTNGNLRITVEDGGKHTIKYDDLNNTMYKRSSTTTADVYVDTTLLELVNQSYIDEKDNEIKVNIVQTNERIDEIVENVGAILESSSVPSPLNLPYPSVDTKLPIKTAAYVRESNPAKLGFDETLNYTFNLNELGTYNIVLDYIITSTASRNIAIKLWKYVDGVTDTLVYSWPVVSIVNNETKNISPLPYPLVKNTVGTDKYYITYAANGTGVTGQGYSLKVDLVVSQNTIPPSVTTNQVYAEGVTDHIDGTPSTSIFNDIISKLGTFVKKTGDTMTGGLSFGNMVGSSPNDLSKHIALNGIAYGMNVFSGALNFVTNGIFKFVNGEGTTIAMIKSVIDDPKSLITKEYLDASYKGCQYIKMPNIPVGESNVLTFTTPMPVSDIVKIVYTGSFTGDSSAGNKGVQMRPNNWQGPYMYRTIEMAGTTPGQPVTTTCLQYSNAANAMVIQQTDLTESDNCFAADIIITDQEWRSFSRSQFYETITVWDAPEDFINTLQFQLASTGTSGAFEQTLAIYSASGKYYPWTINSTFAGTFADEGIQTLEEEV